MKVAHFIFVLASINLANSFVLLQVRKGDNHSNVDTLIHKVIPAKQHKMAESARKQNYKQFNFKTQNNEDLENVLFAIKTSDANGGNQHGGREYGVSDYIKLANILTDIKTSVMDFINTDLQRRNFQSKTENYNTKPESLKPKTAIKPVTYEIETASVLKRINEALDSPDARRYSEKMAKAAAFMYSLINEA